jgi:DNA-binding transcriptional regulator YiaG
MMMTMAMMTVECPRMKQPKTLADRIRTRREALGLSREKLALEWNVALSTIRNWEIGLSEPRDGHREVVEKWLDGRSAK